VPLFTLHITYFNRSRRESSYSQSSDRVSRSSHSVSLTPEPQQASTSRRTNTSPLAQNQLQSLSGTGNKRQSLLKHSIVIQHQLQQQDIQPQQHNPPPSFLDLSANSIKDPTVLVKSNYSLAFSSSPPPPSPPPPTHVHPLSCTCTYTSKHTSFHT
jgi:hypothetical protein